MNERTLQRREGLVQMRTERGKEPYGLLQANIFGFIIPVCFADAFYEQCLSKNISAIMIASGQLYQTGSTKFFHNDIPQRIF